MDTAAQRRNGKARHGSAGKEWRRYESPVEPALSLPKGTARILTQCFAMSQPRPSLAFFLPFACPAVISRIASSMCLQSLRLGANVVL